MPALECWRQSGGHPLEIDPDYADAKAVLASVSDVEKTVELAAAIEAQLSASKAPGT